MTVAQLNAAVDAIRKIVTDMIAAEVPAIFRTSATEAVTDARLLAIAKAALGAAEKEGH